MSKDKKQKGLSIYLTVVILSAIMAIAFGISAIILGQIKVTKEAGYSVIAFYAADAGIERILMNRSAPFGIGQTSLSNGATYSVTVTPGGGANCTAFNYCIKSIGSYRETSRAVEITY